MFGLHKVPFAWAITVRLSADLLTTIVRIKQRFFSSLDEAKTPDAHHAASAVGVAAVTVCDGHIRAFALADQPIYTMQLFRHQFTTIYINIYNMTPRSVSCDNKLIRKDIWHIFFSKINFHF